MKSFFSLLIILSTLFSCSSSSNASRKVGVDPSWYPLNFGNRDPNITTFSTELLAEIGKVEKIPFVKVTVDWNQLMEGLQKNQYEAILTSMPPYIFNEKLFDFSEVYLALGPVIVIPTSSKISGLNDLSGKEIGIVSGSTNVVLLEKSNGALIRYFESTAQALNAVSMGEIDGAMVDVLSASAYCRDLYKNALKIATLPLNDEGLRLVTRHKAAPDLIRRFNEGLNKLKRDGSYKKLQEKWGLQE